MYPKSAMLAVLLWANIRKKESAADGNREDTMKEFISRLRLGDSKSWERRDHFKFRVREAGRGCWWARMRGSLALFYLPGDPYSCYKSLKCEPKQTTRINRNHMTNC